MSDWENTLTEHKELLEMELIEPADYQQAKLVMSDKLPVITTEG